MPGSWGRCVPLDGPERGQLGLDTRLPAPRLPGQFAFVWFLFLPPWTPVAVQDQFLVAGVRDFAADELRSPLETRRASTSASEVDCAESYVRGAEVADVSTGVASGACDRRMDRWKKKGKNTEKRKWKERRKSGGREKDGISGRVYEIASFRTCGSVYRYRDHWLLRTWRAKKEESFYRSDKRSEEAGGPPKQTRGAESLHLNVLPDRFLELQKKMNFLLLLLLRWSLTVGFSLCLLGGWFHT